MGSVGGMTFWVYFIWSVTRRRPTRVLSMTSV
jgi:hypothetical protein